MKKKESYQKYLKSFTNCNLVEVNQLGLGMWCKRMLVKKARHYILLILVFLLSSGSFLYAQEPEFEKPGVVEGLPVFYKKLAQRMDYPFSWLHGGQGSFATWRLKARKKVMESLLVAPPSVPFAAQVLAEQDRGSYIARKIVFNITGDSRVLALMLVPKSPGPHPAGLLLHNHGAKFDIGKEKVIEPFGEPAAKMVCTEMDRKLWGAFHR